VTDLAPVCILAGGRATRLGDAVATTPKPLLPVAGRPFIFHQLELLRRSGAREVVICTGYLGTQFRDTVGDGSRFDLRIRYSDDGPSAIGTAGAVRQAVPLLGERFLVLYGDTYLRIDYAAVDRAASERQLPALMTVLRNEGRWDTSNAMFDGDRVVRYDKVHPDPEMRFIDYGLSVMTAEALRTEPTASDLSTVFHALARAGVLAGYEATERFYEIGTPAALLEADRFLSATERPD
jgi:N-acetyl-alpha-D-muramate 1-phosphate uridylyltransferase